ncbi:cilia- and flagella-associated protein 91-like [Drosophila bipectinata]|uniref:cilia- and flagella-associated protein 91-like n=1 Tax=Drosophila bipectinata TaxID=42026 RepID=UPI001C8929A0|nr:cilia- and flagella-associated protein 91-like [Drosophila bipectinata]
MAPVKEKQSRKDRILQFLQEHRELTPTGLTSPRKEDDSRQKKRVTFTQTKKQRSSGGKSLPKVKETEIQIGLGLTSCLITKSSDTRICGGANNPGERDVGKLPRTDSECRFKSPGMNFLKERNENCASQVLKLVPPKPIRKELKNKCDFFPKFYDNSPFKDQTTQTLYRESSAQTLAYLPEIEKSEKSQKLELFSLSQLLPGDKPPGLHEVEILERSRRRWLFRDSLKQNFQKLFNEARELEIKTKYKPILQAFEWEQWIEREEYIQECQMMRLEIVIKMFDKREKEMHASSNVRIEQACERIEKRRQAGLHKNEIEYQRGMRRITMQLAKTSRKWEKQDTLTALGSPCSEFYGPMIRHGVDPARRNFAPTTGHKAFDMRIDDLEKKVNMKNIQCPFSKLKEWSKPKEYAREYEKNFCNDDHLQKLYESLKTLRTQQDLVKDAPQCLKTRIHRDAVEFDSSDDSYPSFSLPPSQWDSRKSRHTPTQIQKKIRREPEPPKKPDGKFGNMNLEEFENVIKTYEGNYIGWIMQFLDDEMDRLKEQRKLHLFSIVAQKERWRREAQEAGVRQKENDLRMLYEELFQKCNCIHQELSKGYIENILTTDVNNIVGNLAEQKISEEGRKIDEELNRWLESFKLVQNPLTYVPLRLMLRDMVSPNVDATLQHHEKILISQYIVEDVIFNRVWKVVEPFDIATTLSRDLIDRLIDNDLYLFSTDSESDTDHKPSWYEAHAIIRKVIRQSVPGKRWKEENERIIYSIYDDMLDNIIGELILEQEPVAGVPCVQNDTVESKVEEKLPIKLPRDPTGPLRKSVAGFDLLVGHTKDTYDKTELDIVDSDQFYVDKHLLSVVDLRKEGISEEMSSGCQIN